MFTLPDPQADLRREYVKAIKADRAQVARLERAGVEVWEIAQALHGHPAQMDFARFRGLCCGAMTRKGWRCKRIDLWANGRCRLHGGLSTEPRTPEGKARVALNLHASRKLLTPLAGF
jgi:hypothetical protein